MIDVDQLRERMRERVTENAAADYNHGHCLNCNTDLTAADREAGECTNCHSTVESDDDGVDEHLHEDDDSLSLVELEDYLWDGYSHGD